MCYCKNTETSTKSELIRFRIGGIHFSYHLMSGEGSDGPPGGFHWPAHQPGIPQVKFESLCAHRVVPRISWTPSPFQSSKFLIGLTPRILTSAFRCFSRLSCLWLVGLGSSVLGKLMPFGVRTMMVWLAMGCDTMGSLALGKKINSAFKKYRALKSPQYFPISPDLIYPWEGNGQPREL